MKNFGSDLISTADKKSLTPVYTHMMSATLGNQSTRGKTVNQEWPQKKARLGSTQDRLNIILTEQRMRSENLFYGLGVGIGRAIGTRNDSNKIVIPDVNSNYWIEQIRAIPGNIYRFIKTTFSSPEKKVVKKTLKPKLQGIFIESQLDSIFHSINNHMNYYHVVNTLKEYQFHRFQEIATPKEVCNAINLVSQKGPIKFVVISGHGSPYEIQLGLNNTWDQYISIDKFFSDQHYAVQDLSCFSLLAKDVKIILSSCQVARTGHLVVGLSPKGDGIYLPFSVTSLIALHAPWSTIYASEDIIYAGTLTLGYENDQLKIEIVSSEYGFTSMPFSFFHALGLSQNEKLIDFKSKIMPLCQTLNYFTLQNFCDYHQIKPHQNITMACMSNPSCFQFSEFYRAKTDEIKHRYCTIEQDKISLLSLRGIDSSRETEADKFYIWIKDYHIPWIISFSQIFLTVVSTLGITGFGLFIVIDKAILARLEAQYVARCAVRFAFREILDNLQPISLEETKQVSSIIDVALDLPTCLTWKSAMKNHSDKSEVDEIPSEFSIIRHK